jgi:hypothetical protein
VDFIARIFDITKLPSKFFAWAVALTGLFLFLPDSYLARLHLNELPKEYKAHAGIVFVGALSFLLINFSIWCWGSLKAWRRSRKAQRLAVEAMSTLDRAEKYVLREFFLQDRNVIELPFDHPTVAGLARKGVVQIAGSQGYRSLAGSVFPVTLTESARKLLTLEQVDLPEQPSEGDLERIRGERPNFIRDIARHDDLRGGL